MYQLPEGSLVYKRRVVMMVSEWFRYSLGLKYTFFFPQPYINYLQQSSKIHTHRKCGEFQVRFLRLLLRTLYSSHITSSYYCTFTYRILYLNRNTKGYSFLTYKFMCVHISFKGVQM